jgi:hypothetical protein
MEEQQRQYWAQRQRAEQEQQQVKNRGMQEFYGERKFSRNSFKFSI